MQPRLSIFPVGLTPWKCKVLSCVAVPLAELALRGCSWLRRDAKLVQSCQGSGHAMAVNGMAVPMAKNIGLDRRPRCLQYFGRCDDVFLWTRRAGVPNRCGEVQNAAGLSCLSQHLSSVSDGKHPSSASLLNTCIVFWTLQRQQAQRQMIEAQGARIFLRQVGTPCC